MMKKNLLLIINGSAGTRQARRFIPDMIGIFSRGGYTSTTYLTEKKGNARELVEQYGKNTDMIVCVGGDGTVNEVSATVIDNGITTPIGYIPAGSTNDFANSLGLSKNILGAARDLMVGEPISLDMGCFDSEYFSYVASFGAFSRVSYSTSQSAKNALGHLAYVLEGIKDIPSIRPWHLRIETDTEVFEDDYIMGFISNSTSVGGVLTLDPDLVDMSDGLFEIVLIKMPKTILELNECVWSMKTQNYDSDLIVFHSASHANIMASADMDWSLDGEYAAGREHIEVKNLHGVVRYIINGKQSE